MEVDLGNFDEDDLKFRYQRLRGPASATISIPAPFLSRNEKNFNSDKRDNDNNIRSFDRDECDFNEA